MRAVHDGLVKAPYCPPNLDGTPIASVKHKGSAMPSGRPAKAQKGDYGKLLDDAELADVTFAVDGASPRTARR